MKHVFHATNIQPTSGRGWLQRLEGYASLAEQVARACDGPGPTHERTLAERREVFAKIAADVVD